MLALIVSALVSAAPVVKPADPMAEDVQCLTVLLGALGRNDGEMDRMLLMAGTSYYLGRIDARDPRYDIEAGIGAVIRTLGPDAMRAAVAPCLVRLKERGEALEEMSGRIAKIPGPAR